MDGALVNGAPLTLKMGPNNGFVRTRQGKETKEVENKEPKIVITIKNETTEKSRKGRGSFRFSLPQ
jgi:hypothetical protein